MSRYVYCSLLSEAITKFDESNKDSYSLEESHERLVDLAKTVIVVKAYLIEKYRLKDDRERIRELRKPMK